MSLDADRHDKLVRLEAENEKLRTALEDCRRTITEPNPGICCTVWFASVETLLDRIDRALKTT